MLQCRFLSLVGVISLGLSGPGLADDAKVNSNVSVRFMDWHFADDPMMLAPPSSLANAENQCGSIHQVSWSCPDADGDVITYRAALEQRWSKMDGIMDRIQRHPQKYDRHDLDYKLSQIGLSDNQLHDDLLAKRKSTRFAIKMFEHSRH